MKNSNAFIEAAANKISKQARYEHLKQPRETDDQYLARMRDGFRRRLIYDPSDWSLFGLRISSIRPTKPLADGWTFGWHAWNKGFTLAYRTPVLKSHVYMAFAEDTNGSIIPHKVMTTEKPTFWQRRFPKHFTFTVAKLCGKWRFTRAYDPFMEASLAATPILSAQEWKRLSANDGPVIYSSVDELPDHEKRYSELSKKSYDQQDLRWRERTKDTGFFSDE